MVLLTLKVDGDSIFNELILNMKVDIFLKLKPIKVIFFTLFIPVVLQLFIINFFMKFFDSDFIYYFLFGIFYMLYVPYFYWLNSITNSLYSLQNHFFNLKMKYFKITLFVNMLVILNFVFFVAYTFKFVYENGEPNHSLFVYIFISQIIGIVSFAMNSYFVSKLIVTLELNRKVKLSDFLGNFIVLSIPPIAIWLIQNKARKIFEEKQSIT